MMNDLSVKCNWEMQDVGAFHYITKNLVVLFIKFTADGIFIFSSTQQASEYFTTLSAACQLFSLQHFQPPK